MPSTAAAITGGALALTLGLVALAPAPGADAAPRYANCTELNKGKYPHGVGKKGAVDKTSGKKVRTFTVDNKAYKKYSTSVRKGGYGDMDRDNDGIACEKR